MKDPVPDEWRPPFTMDSLNPKSFVDNTGKQVGDSVESLIGAVFLSTSSIHTTCQFIAEIDLIPYDYSPLPPGDITFNL